MLPRRTLALPLLFAFGADLSIARCEPFFQLSNQADAELAAVAVHIVEDPKQNWKGGGVYLGNGFILTAAHVVGSSWFTRPMVEASGVMLPAEIVRKGNFNDDDLTVLRVDEAQLPMRLRLRHVVICHQLPPLGSAVVVATPEGTARSKLVVPAAITPRVRALFPTLIPDVETTGNSGSGVYEATSQCLLGIMSRKISAISYENKGGARTKVLHDIAKFFVSSATILRAIPSWVRF